MPRTEHRSSLRAETLAPTQAAVRRSGGDGLEVAEALELDCLAGGRIIAGAAGSRRLIRVVNIMEVPDIVRWMRGGEFLLTTGHPVRNDPEVLTAMVPELAARGVAAFGIKVGPYLAEPPASMLRAADELAFPIVEVPGETMFNDILSDVLGKILNRQAVELEHSWEIHQRLTDVMLAGGSFQELVTALRDLIQLPVAILDLHGQVIAAAGDHPEDLTEADPVKVTRPVHNGEARSGEIVVWPGEASIEPSDLNAVEQVATIAAVAMARERIVLNRVQRHRSLLLMELVSGRPMDRAELAENAAAMGWDLGIARAAAVIDVASDDGPVKIVGQPIEDGLLRTAREALGPLSIVWGLPSGLAALVEPGPTLGAACQRAFDRLSTSYPGLRIMIGVGPVSPDIDGLERSYREAAEALGLGRQIHRDSFVVQLRELSIYRLLCQLPESELVRHRDENLGQLLEYDRRHHGSLLATLEAYIEHGGNRAETARRLFVHYNTLRYRMEQIEQLVGDTDRGSTRRMSIELGLYAHRLLTARRMSQLAVVAPDPSIKPVRRERR